MPQWQRHSVAVPPQAQCRPNAVPPDPVTQLEPLPVDPVVPEVLQALAQHGACVLVAPPGAGKTTRVPPAIAATLRNGPHKAVWVLEPRRIAARAAARRVAQEQGAKLGDDVGYRVRFDNKAGKHTRVVFVTEGILLRRLQEDPFLEGIGALVFDEFHERHLDGDLALAMAKRVRDEAREDLQLCVMSATLEAEPVAAFLANAPVVVSEGRTYPVETRHLSIQPRETEEQLIVRGVKEALAWGAGDVLVFLPGVGEIRRAGKALGRLKDADVRELYGDLPPDKQDAALRPGPRRRVVLATNVAESSVTVAGVRAVVDTGRARQLGQDPGTGLDKLTVERISIASADQRAGRAGREGPGLAIRLWSPAEERTFLTATEPEVRRIDLAGPVLQLLAFGEADPARFPWFETPRRDGLRRAQRLLDLLGATRAGKLTPLGRDLARLPVHPRLGRLLVEGHRLGVPDAAALAAATLADRDPFVRGSGGSHHVSDSDVLDRVLALQAFERDGTRHAGPRELHQAAARNVLRARDQLSRLAHRVLGDAPQPEGRRDDALLQALLAAYADRLAVRRPAGSDRGRMVGGRGVRIGRDSAVKDADLFLCVDLDGAGQEAWVRVASAVDREWVDGGETHQVVEPAFDADKERIVGRRRTYLGPLLLEESDHPLAHAHEGEALLAEVAADRLDRALALDDPALAAFRNRVACLAEWRPELNLPDLGEDRLRDLLPALVIGCRNFADLRRAPLLDHLRGSLSRDQQRVLDLEAPERILVPSGNRIRLEYELGRPPVLAVRVQELFGLEDSPTVAGGRVRVLMHLLGPNRRPQQVTDDLGSFWDNTYGLLRKELRRRYPKHAWPEDPRQGIAERRPGRRRRRR